MVEFKFSHLKNWLITFAIGIPLSASAANTESEIKVNNRITNQKHTYCGFIYYVNPLKVCLCFLYFHHEQAIKLFIYYLWNAFYHPVQ